MEYDGEATLLPPPPDDASKAPIENTLEVTPMPVLGPDIFTNTRPPWLPAGARGIFGGAVIALCLASAQKTLETDFVAHSCHCFFLLPGAQDVPMLIHVERVRDGRSFATRTVQARQRGRCIFTTTISFVRVGSGGRAHVRHAAPMPADAGAPPAADCAELEPEFAGRWPFQVTPIKMRGLGDDGVRPDQCSSQQWLRCRGAISAAGGHAAHLNALAYMSDSYFIGAVSRIHRLWRFPFAPEDVPELPPGLRRMAEQLNEFEGMGPSLDSCADSPRLDMLVSLDHTIYFHNPLHVAADDWMFTEMESPWAGEGRGVVTRRIFHRDGTLLATCVQEGVVRLAPDSPKDSGQNSAKL